MYFFLNDLCITANVFLKWPMYNNECTFLTWPIYNDECTFLTWPMYNDECTFFKMTYAQQMNAHHLGGVGVVLFLLLLFALPWVCVRVLPPGFSCREWNCSVCWPPACPFWKATWVPSCDDAWPSVAELAPASCISCWAVIAAPPLCPGLPPTPSAVICWLVNTEYVKIASELGLQLNESGVQMN